MSPDASTRASLRSDFSFYSDEDTCTSSVDASPAAGDCTSCGWCLGTELAKISCLSECYLVKAPCEPEFRVPAFRASSTEHVASDDDTIPSIIDKDTRACKDAFERQDSDSDGCSRAEFVVDAEVDQPKLNQDTLVVERAPLDPRMDAVAKAVHSALASSGRAKHVGTQIRDQGSGTSSVLICAEANGDRTFASSYDVVRLAKNELEAAVARVKTLKLVSSRLQKEDFGYSVRSSIALVPEGLGDRMCWDMFRHGYCARGHQCRWEHPRSSQLDNRRIKINIRHAGEASDASSEEPHVTVEGTNSQSGRRLRKRSSAGRQTLRSSAGRV